MGKLQAHVQFVFTQREFPGQFYDWLVETLSSAMASWDARNKKTAEAVLWGYGFSEKPTDEGGVGSFWLQNQYIRHCKMHWFDGSPDTVGFYVGAPWYGIVFRDHDTPESNIAKVHLIADAFEEHLKAGRIPYERVNFES